MTAEQRLQRIDDICAEIKANMARPGLQTLTSEQLRLRANCRRDIVTTLKINGGRVNPAYE